MYTLFLDDERFPKDPNAIIARTVQDAQAIIAEKGMPNHIDFDHDLGVGPNGADLARWLIEQDLDETLCFPENFTYHIHSQNPIGRANIQGLLDSYFKTKT